MSTVQGIPLTAGPALSSGGISCHKIGRIVYVHGTLITANTTGENLVLATGLPLSLGTYASRGGWGAQAFCEVFIDGAHPYLYLNTSAAAGTIFGFSLSYIAAE